MAIKYIWFTRFFLQARSAHQVAGVAGSKRLLPVLVIGPL
jgi:hypothetical protein